MEKNEHSKDLLLSSYQFQLPSERIAQKPPSKRGLSRLLVCSRNIHDIPPTICHTQFSAIAKYLPKNALLIANNAKVLSARLLGRRPSGGALEFLLLTPLALILEAKEPSALGPSWHEAKATGLMRSNSRVRIGDTFVFADDLRIQVTACGPFGHKEVILSFQGDLAAIFARIGHIPLPPYIHRQDCEDDKNRDQTVYARDDKLGAVAAPTAGLHFTKEIREELLAQGFLWKEVTLYVGYGTFSPVRCENIVEHTMHSEYIEIPDDTAQAIVAAKKEGRAVIAVGTTSVRTLEGVFAKEKQIVPYRGETNIFLYPGKEFHVVDGLITNFHLPGSSLLMLVSAFAGRSRMLAIYEEAIRCGYMFFSYGDCMFIAPSYK